MYRNSSLCKIPRKVFNSFVLSVADDRRASNENTQCGVVAETMKLLGNSFYGYQIIDISKATMTKILETKKTTRL